MTSDDQLPGFEHMIEQYDHDDHVRKHAHHNHNDWRWIHGGLALIHESPLDFEPRRQYWHCTERRLLVAFFATKFQERYVPAVAMRQLAFKTFRHFEMARADGRLGERQFVSIQSGLMAEFCDKAIRVADELPELDEYVALRQIWGRRLPGPTLKDELIEYLSAARDHSSPEILELSFYIRLLGFHIWNWNISAI
jgi:hypothetical protein